MPAVLSYPGVYVEEVPSGVRTIVGVATSVTAFIGRARRGPVNDPVTVNSFADFEREFGGLWENSYLGFAVRDFFQNGGSQAVIVRLFHPIYATDQSRSQALAAAQAVAAAVVAVAVSPTSTPMSLGTAARTKADTYKNSGTATPEEIAASDAVAKSAEAAAYPDSDAAKAVAEIARAEANKADSADILKTMTAGLLATAAEEAAALANATSVTVAAAVKAAGQAVKDAVEAVAAAGEKEVTDNSATATPTSVKTAIANEASTYPTGPAHAAAILVVQKAAEAEAQGGATKESVRDAARAMADQIKAAVDADTVAPAATAKAQELIKRVTDAVGSLTISAAAPLGRARIDWDTLRLEAASEGSWGNRLRIRVDYNTKDPSVTTLFNLTVRDVGTGATETHRNLSVTPNDARHVGAVLRNESNLVRLRSDIATRPSRHDDPPADVSDPFDDNAVTATATPHSKVTEQGADGQDLSKDDFIGTGKEANKQGLYALENADLFNLLCIPPYAASNGEALDVDGQIWSSAATYCVKRRAMLIVDPPAAWTDKKKAKDGLDGLGTKSMNAAVFFPRLVQPNPLRNDQKERFVPCGAVAGVVARTDATRGVWKAPAGLEAMLTGVPELSVSLTDAENGELNPLGLNCLRTMAPAGRVVWGARTLQGDDRFASEWKYIPVRRTALFIEETLYRNLRWVVFEPNDEPLWAQIRLNVGAFMQDLFRQGAFQGQSPRDAYFVKCSRETTTQSDINRGVVNIWVGFAPLKPAEFVVIKLQQIAGQIQT
jgi:phage tail sheath protein FI